MKLTRLLPMERKYNSAKTWTNASGKRCTPRRQCGDQRALRPERSPWPPPGTSRTGLAIIDESDTTTCPYCAETIQRRPRAAWAHCGSDIPKVRQHDHQQHSSSHLLGAPPCTIASKSGMGRPWRGTGVLRDQGMRTSGRTVPAQSSGTMGYRYRRRGDKRNQCLAEIKGSQIVATPSKRDDRTGMPRGDQIVCLTAN